MPSHRQHLQPVASNSGGVIKDIHTVLFSRIIYWDFVVEALMHEVDNLPERLILDPLHSYRNMFQKMTNCSYSKLSIPNRATTYTTGAGIPDPRLFDSRKFDF